MGLSHSGKLNNSSVSLPSVCAEWRLTSRNSIELEFLVDTRLPVFDIGRPVDLSGSHVCER